MNSIWDFPYFHFVPIYASCMQTHTAHAPGASHYAQSMIHSSSNFLSFHRFRSIFCSFFKFVFVQPHNLFYVCSGLTFSITVDFLYDSCQLVKNDSKYVWTDKHNTKEYEWIFGVCMHWPYLYKSITVSHRYWPTYHSKIEIKSRTLAIRENANWLRNHRRSKAT